ncbi:MAG: ribonuclease HII [Anaerolineae bacterium]|nr:ribonuclease HII [Anaerolineae bacterium]
MTHRPSQPLPDLDFELALWQHGLTDIAGLDEAGRGAWAGPVAAAAVILPPDRELLHRLHGVRDSKQMTAAQRGIWAAEIQRAAKYWAVGFSSHREIDQFGILPATRLAMARALAQLSITPAHLLLDAVCLNDDPTPQTILIKGDQRCLSIAAASILAKTARDALMITYSTTYPGYGFEYHKGYGTRKHQAALDRLGICEIHRLSYQPIQKRLTQSQER